MNRVSIEYVYDESQIPLDNQSLLHKNQPKPNRGCFTIYKRWILTSGIITILLVFISSIAFAYQKSDYQIIKKTVHKLKKPWFENQQTHKISKKVTNKPKNVIMMISDGLGPASVSFARTYYQYINDKPFDFEMPLDKIHVGQSRTRSSSSLVTDSAAGATAFSCNLKTYNGAIGVDPNKQPCGTVLESAKHRQQMLTGLVATSRITHATPASFSAHVQNRNNENAIAIQQIGENPLGRTLDLMFGGGYCHFLPKSHTDGCRFDSRDLLNEAKEKHQWKTVLYKNKTQFEQLPIDASVLPVISLFTFDHMSYEIDRNATIEPSLSEMSKKALDILFEATKDKDKGFFLMIEGSRIDMAGHSNDPATHVHEILEYQNTVEVVKIFVDQHPDTVMISTSDHETGGLSLAKQVSTAYPEYLWYPDVLTKVKCSTVKLAKLIKQLGKPKKEDVTDLVKNYLGISDIKDEETSELIKPYRTEKRLDQFLANMVSIRAQLGWSTHGHSGVDVNLYAYGLGSRYLMGSHENIEIGQFITKALDLNLTEITHTLNMNNPKFHLTNLTEEEKLQYNENLEHYHSV